MGTTERPKTLQDGLKCREKDEKCFWVWPKGQKNVLAQKSEQFESRKRFKMSWSVAEKTNNAFKYDRE